MDAPAEAIERAAVRLGMDQVEVSRLMRDAARLRQVEAVVTTEGRRRKAEGQLIPAVRALLEEWQAVEAGLEATASRERAHLARESCGRLLRSFSRMLLSLPTIPSAEQAVRALSELTADLPDGPIAPVEHATSVVKRRPEVPLIPKGHEPRVRVPKGPESGLSTASVNLLAAIRAGAETQEAMRAALKRPTCKGFPAMLLHLASRGLVRQEGDRWLAEEVTS